MLAMQGCSEFTSDVNSIYPGSQWWWRWQQSV